MVYFQLLWSKYFGKRRPCDLFLLEEIVMRFGKVIEIWEKIFYYPVFIGHLFILQTKIGTRRKLEKLVEKCRKDLRTIRHMKIKDNVRHCMDVSHNFLSEIFFMIKWTFGFFIFVWRIKVYVRFVFIILFFKFQKLSLLLRYSNFGVKEF